MKREKEIKEFIKKLEKLWLRHPYERFGQLLFNCTSFGIRGDKLGTVIDPFHFQDERIFNEIKENLYEL